MTPKWSTGFRRSSSEGPRHRGRERNRAMTILNLKSIASALGGNVTGRQVLAHNRATRRKTARLRSPSRMKHRTDLSFTVLLAMTGGRVATTFEPNSDCHRSSGDGREHQQTIRAPISISGISASSMLRPRPLAAPRTISFGSGVHKPSLIKQSARGEPSPSYLRSRALDLPDHRRQRVAIPSRMLVAE